MKLKHPLIAVENKYIAKAISWASTISLGLT